MNKVTMIGIGSILVIVLISALMIPMTSEFSKNIYSYEENENVRYSLSDRNETVKITTVGGIAKINNYALSELLESGNQLFMFGDTFILMYTPQTTTEGTTTPEAITFFDAATSSSKSGVTSANFADGEFTVSGTANDASYTLTGTYSFAFHASEHGEYCAASGPIVSTKATLYLIRAVENSTFGIYSGTYDNMTKLFYSSGDLTDLAISADVNSVDPDTVKITTISGVTGKFNLIVPYEYPHVSNVDSITRTIVTLMPLFVGILLFAVIGVSLTRLTKY